jgi:Ca-activated chloride channel family protein
VKVEVATCPWDIAHRLARISVKARDARAGAGEKPVASELTTNVKFNPASVNAWRLIGYETGEPAPGGSFPAADLAPGAAVTALYEIALVPGSNPSSASPARLFTVSIHYRDTARAQRETIKAVASDTGAGFDRADEDFHFASAVAAFGMLLRDCKYAGKATYADVIRWATAGKGADESGQRAEFIDLARRARDLAR